MSELVKRLREWDAIESDMKTVPRGLCSEAADEIERLRKENKAIRWGRDQNAQAADVSDEENARLRAALERIADNWRAPDGGCWWCDDTEHFPGPTNEGSCPVRIAEEALK